MTTLPAAIPSAVTLDAIIEAVSQFLHVSLDDMAGESRCARIAEARHLFCWLASRYGRSSHRAIGQRIKRTHATVNHSIRQADALRRTDEQFLAYSEQLDATFRRGI